jgi:hypothetical protein
MRALPAWRQHVTADRCEGSGRPTGKTHPHDRRIVDRRRFNRTDTNEILVKDNPRAGDVFAVDELWLLTQSRPAAALVPAAAPVRAASER